MDRPQFGRDELEVLLRELRRTISDDITGDVVELGCYMGETSVHLAKTLHELSSGKRLFIYDSFEGLPPKNSEDASPAGDQFKSGELQATKKDVIKRLKRAGCSDVRVIKAWFNELDADDLPEKISFAFLDGDFYQSVKDSLQLVWGKLTPGAVVVIDDYRNEALPGATKAVDEWVSGHSVKNMSVEKSLAILRL